MTLNLSKFKSKLIRIDSSMASEYINEYKTSFIYSFDNITTEPNESIVYSLLSISIPYSYYSTNRNNQYLDIHETINGVSSTVNIIMPAGNYTAITYATTLLSEINTTHITYAIIYNKTQNRYIISIVTPNCSAVLLFRTGENHDTSNYKFLGFDKVDIHISNTPILSSNCVTMSDIYYLQLKTDLDSTTTLISDGFDGILETINIPTQPYSMLQHTPIEINRYLLPQKSLRSINMSLLDNFNNDINLNGLPFYCVIKIEIINNEEYKLITPQGRDSKISHDEAPFVPSNAIQVPRPVNISDLIDYNNITRMMQDVSTTYKRHKKNNNITYIYI